MDRQDKLNDLRRFLKLPLDSSKSKTFTKQELFDIIDLLKTKGGVVSVKKLKSFIRP